MSKHSNTVRSLKTLTVLLMTKAIAKFTLMLYLCWDLAPSDLSGLYWSSGVDVK